MSEQVGPPLPTGITKEITRYSSAQKYLPPQPGDEVEVHFTASVKKGGAQFESSKERGQPFVYKVGQGQVIDGWERAVQTMRKGEHAKFTIEPQFAYGEAGLREDESDDSDAAAQLRYRVPPNSVVVLELELIKHPMREDLFEDGGAVKLELKQGKENARQIRSGDECQITYKVTVEGCGETMGAKEATYKVAGEKMGQIQKVIDKALCTMKRGDEAMVRCSPAYAYGDGSGKYAGKVAMISLALEEIYECHDVSLGLKDKVVLRKRIREGEGTDRIHDTAQVTLRVVSVTSGAQKVVKEPRQITFTAGNGEVCDALEGAVIWMKQGDEALVRCESADACVGGISDLPEGLEAPVMIQIVVLQMEKVQEKWDMNPAERIRRGESRKETAGGLFKQGRLRLACQHYETVADLYARLDFFPEELRPRAAELKRVADLNRAMCMLKLGNMKTVDALCSSVLHDEPSNPKALFRRAKARVALKEYDGALDDLQRLLDIEPSSRDGRELMREAKRLRKQTNEKASTTYSKMVASLGSMPERTDRRDDDYVVAPNLEEESARIRQQYGLPPKRQPAVEATPPAFADTAIVADTGDDRDVASAEPSPQSNPPDGDDGTAAADADAGAAAAPAA